MSKRLSVSRTNARCVGLGRACPERSRRDPASRAAAIHGFWVEQRFSAAVHAHSRFRASARGTYLFHTGFRLATRYSQLTLPILPHFPIQRHRNILVCLHIPKLHHLMLFPRQFPPPARLLRILLNCLQDPPIHPELNHPQPPAPHSLDPNFLSLENDFLAIHQLCSHRSQNFLHLSQDHSPEISCVGPGRACPERSRRDPASREAAKECSPRRKPWVRKRNKSQPRRGERQPRRRLRKEGTIPLTLLK